MQRVIELANFLDKTIGFFSPRWQLKREYARLALDSISTRKFDAASTGKRLSSWAASGASADTEIMPALARLRNRSRELIRNNYLAKKGRRTITNHTIGLGIMPKPIGESQRAKELMQVWKNWGDSKVCDFNNRLNFYGIQRLVMDTVVESGECLVLRVPKKFEFGKVPLEIMVLEPDFIDSYKNQRLPSGNWVKNGIEFTPLGKVEAYWLYTQHPGEQGVISVIHRNTSVRVPANEIIHVFLQERPGQNFGIPWLSAVAVTLKDCSDYEDAQLIRQKIAACFTGFVRDIELSDSIKQGKTSLLERIEPGRIEYLGPGKDIVFANPPSTQGYAEYIKVQKQNIAAGLGITYESLTADLSQVNFSSARIGQNDMQVNIGNWQYEMIIPLLCDGVWQWFEQACELSGVIPLGEPLGATWIPPKRTMVDVISETKAMREQVRAGFKTLSEAISEYGYDPKTHLEEYAKDLKTLDTLGIVLDSDPRVGQGISKLGESTEVSSGNKTTIT